MITELYTVYRTELLKYCCMICGNVSDAEDLLQETFMKALSNLDLLEELGTKEEYQKYVEKGNMICGDSVGAFIRAQIGVDRIVAVESFSKFLSGASLNTMQEEYLKTIITYVCENGDITTGTLVNVSPFSEYDWSAIFGQNLVSVRDYVNNLHNIIIPSSERMRA